MHLSTLQVHGLRATANGALDARIPGRFAVLIGTNGAGKKTMGDAMYLSHRRTLPRLPRPSSATLGRIDRQVTVEHAFAEADQVAGPLVLSLKALSGEKHPGEGVAP